MIARKLWRGEDSSLRPMDYEGSDRLKFIRAVELLKNALATDSLCLTTLKLI